MTAQVTSAFLYVHDVVKSYEFYHEIVGAEIGQIHKAQENGPITLALLRLGNFTLMIHPQEEHAADFVNNKPGIGIHLQLRVDDIDAFHQHCLDEARHARRLRRACSRTSPGAGASSPSKIPTATSGRSTRTSRAASGPDPNPGADPDPDGG